MGQIQKFGYKRPFALLDDGPKRVNIFHSKRRHDPVRIREKQVAKILAAIYFDINYVCILRRAVRAQQAAREDHPNVVRYRSECAGAAALIDRAVHETRYQGFLNTRDTDPSEILPIDVAENMGFRRHRRQVRRLRTTVFRLGWKLLAICAHSEAFRRACKEIDHQPWDLLFKQLSGNRQSIEVFARSRNLEWRGPLVHHNLRTIYRTLRCPDINLQALGHPHHIVRKLDGSLCCPVFENTLQEHIDSPIFLARNWRRHKTDPTRRRPIHGACDLCWSKETCNCVFPSLAGCLVELVEYLDKGIGVRALANFKKKDILDLFLGELRPCSYDDDRVYALVQEPKVRMLERPIAVISPKQYGNWTRFINHSCNPSTEFARRTIGSRIYMTVEATRDISIYEEITIDYGDGYFEADNTLCHCMTDECRFNSRI